MTGPAFGQRKIDNALVVHMTKHHRGLQILIRDTEQSGFFVRVSARGQVSFGVAYSFDGRERRMSLGTYPELSVLAARKLATTRKAQVQLTTGSKGPVSAVAVISATGLLYPNPAFAWRSVLLLRQAVATAVGTQADRIR